MADCKKYLDGICDCHNGVCFQFDKVKPVNKNLEIAIRAYDKCSKRVKK